MLWMDGSCQWLYGHPSCFATDALSLCPLAPFFLPTAPGLESRFVSPDGSDGTADGASRVRRLAVDSAVTVFVKKLRDGSQRDNCTLLTG